MESKTIDVVFPPSSQPKMRKLIIRNSSKDVLVAKIKTPMYKKKNMSLMIPPNDCHDIMLVLIPQGYAELFNPAEHADIGKTIILLKNNDLVEIYCRPLSIDGSSNIFNKMQCKMRSRNTGEVYRVKHAKLVHDVFQLNHKEQMNYWNGYINNFFKKNPERLRELMTWTSLNLYEPEKLSHKLRVVSDSKRFAAPVVLVEIPGNASLVESVVNPRESIDYSDCITARNLTDDVSTMRPFEKNHLLNLAVSESQCKTVHSINKMTSCNLLGRWIGWFLPVNVNA